MYIEFVVGKGYLSSTLTDASSAKGSILLDVCGFRNKADRCSVETSLIVLVCNLVFVS